MCIAIGAEFPIELCTKIRIKMSGYQQDLQFRELTMEMCLISRRINSSSIILSCPAILRALPRQFA